MRNSGLTFTRVGLIPEFGGTYLLPRILGLGKALELVLTGRTLEAREAHEIGLVNKVVPPDQLMDEAREMARMTLKAPPLALQLCQTGAPRRRQFRLRGSHATRSDV